MGDSTDGSSRAAHSAQAEGQNETRGFFTRLVSALSPRDLGEETPDDDPANRNAAADRQVVQPGMLNLRRMRVDDVAIPRAEIVSVATDIKKDELVEVFRESGLTRLPVFKETLDTPVGLVHLKDFALKHGFNGGGPRYALSKMLRPLLFAPPSMPIGVLLQKMQSERIHMALVIDEYGGVDGLVTIEDLVEQVVGEIEDEHDLAEDALWQLEKPGIYLAEARTPLDEFEAECGCSLRSGLEDEEIDTLGGLVFLLAGRVPLRREVIPHPAGIEFEVLDADPRRVKRLRVRLPEQASHA